jgi:dTDP-4-dehydrorhamnose reductase
MMGEGRRFKMVSDRVGSPTYLSDLARAIVTVMVTPYRGILHFANTGEPTSRYHLLKELAAHLGRHTTDVAVPEAAWTEMSRRPTSPRSTPASTPP